MENEAVKKRKERLKDKMRRELGHEVCRLLTMPFVTNILLNDDNRLWFERLSQPMKCLGTINPIQSEAAIKTIAAYYDTIVTSKTPIFEGRLPLDETSRFEGMIPPIVTHPVFAIRRHCSQIINFDEYIAHHVMSKQAADMIRRSIERFDNIIICGGTGSGKTTLLNTCIDYATKLYPQRRRVIIEDTPELKRLARNCIMLHAYDDNPKANGLALLKATMRLYPDAIDYGEVRDGAAHTLLKAWITGHPGGFSSMHVTPGKSGLVRLEQLLLESQPHPMPQLIGDAVQLFVNIQETADGLGRKITNITKVNGYRDGHYNCKQIPI